MQRPQTETVSFAKEYNEMSKHVENLKAEKESLIQRNVYHSCFDFVVKFICLTNCKIPGALTTEVCQCATIDELALRRN